MLTFEAFKLSGRDVADLQAVPEVAHQIGHDDHKPGRVYLDGGLWIERESDGRWFVQIERSDYTSSDRETVERHLYDFYRAEYGEDTTEAFKAALRKVSEASDRRDAFVASNYVAVGGAHPVTMATQGMSVYERMEFDRTL